MGMSKAKDNPSTWNWWRHHHGYAFIPALKLTLRAWFVWPMQDVYAGIWLKGFALKIRYMPWTKYAKMNKRMQLFKDE